MVVNVECVGPDDSLTIANEGATFVNGKCMKNWVMVKSMEHKKNFVVRTPPRFHFDVEWEDLKR